VQLQLQLQLPLLLQSQLQLLLLLLFLLSFPKGICLCFFFVACKGRLNQRPKVISTEDAHSLTVSIAAEKSAFVVVCFAVILSEGKNCRRLHL
jgi:hypothetical protein